MKNSMVKTARTWTALALIVAGALITGVLVRGQGAAMGDAVLQPMTHDVTKELAMKITEPFTFAAVGDIIIRRPVGTGDAGYQALTRIMRDADMTYANMEGPILDEATFRGPLAGGPKSVADELKISRELLYKAAQFTGGEFAEVQRHVEKGVAMLETVGGSLRRVIPIVLAHHDKFNGSGYHPTEGEAIPLEARIITVADVYDALTSDRPYRKAMSPFDAKEIIVKGAAIDFDPVVVDAFVAAFRFGEMDVRSEVA